MNKEIDLKDKQKIRPLHKKDKLTQDFLEWYIDLLIDKAVDIYSKEFDNFVYSNRFQKKIHFETKGLKEAYFLSDI